MNSQYLREMVEGNIIPDWVAQRLDQLSSEGLKEQAAAGLKAVMEGALERYCDALEHPKPRALYQTPPAPAPAVSASPAVRTCEKISVVAPDEKSMGPGLQLAGTTNFSQRLIGRSAFWNWLKARSWMEWIFLASVSWTMLWGSVQWVMLRVNRHEPQATGEGLPMAPPAGDGGVLQGRGNRDGAQPLQRWRASAEESVADGMAATAVKGVPIKEKDNHSQPSRTSGRHGNPAPAAVTVAPSPQPPKASHLNALVHSVITGAGSALGSAISHPVLRQAVTAATGAANTALDAAESGANSATPVPAPKTPQPSRADPGEGPGG